MKTSPRLLLLAIALIASFSLNSQAATGDLYFGDSQTNTIFRFTRTGEKTTFATNVNLPAGMAFDQAGNLFCVEVGTHSILKFTPAGERTVFANVFSQPQGIAFDAGGNLYVTNDKTIGKIPPDDKHVTIFATASKSLVRIAFDAAGNLFGTTGDSVLKFAPNGTESTFSSGYVSASGIALDGGNNVYVVDTIPGGARTLYKVTPAGGKTTFAQLPGNTITLAYDGAGRLYTATYSGGDQLVAININNSAQTVLATGLRGDGLTVEPPRGVPLNIATRLNIQTGDNALIGGFIITGSAPKKVLIRGIGPSLMAVGVAGALQDPTIELRNSSGGFVNGNDDWRSTQQAAIQATGLAPTDERESALLITLGPGAYTVIVRGKNNTTGVGLVEVYDLDQAADSRLANISTRGFIEGGEKVMIGGFIVQSNGTKALIRALGPSLGAFGIANFLPDPFLKLHNGNGELIGQDDNWQDTQGFEIQQTGIQPTNVHESAILINLPPGNYTAVVSGSAGNPSGVGVVEEYTLK